MMRPDNGRFAISKYPFSSVAPQILVPFTQTLTPGKGEALFSPRTTWPAMDPVLISANAKRMAMIIVPIRDV